MYNRLTTTYTWLPKDSTMSVNRDSYFVFAIAGPCFMTGFNDTWS